MPDPQTISSTSQNFLDIHDITNDIVILKNGSAAVVLTVNAMNFGLLAEQEQDSIIYSYAGLLNSINYPIQILIQSQTKDASSYLKLLEKRTAETKDKLKQAWIRRYSKFVSDLIRERNVLDKKFFVIIPASSLEMGLTPGQNLVSGFKEQSIEGVEKSIILEKAKNLLDPKKDHLIAQFNRIGLYARQLSTEEIIRLFYTNYNPEASEGQQITNSENYTTALVQAQIRGNYMNDQTLTPTPTTQSVATPNPVPNAAPTTPLTPANPPEATTAPAAPTTPIAPTQPTENNQPSVEPITTPTTSTEVNISESPTLQPPTSVVTSAVTKPVAPTIPAAAPTIDPVEPVSSPAPVAPVAPSPTPTPTETPTTPSPTPMPNIDNTQKNIDETINQMTETPTQ